MASTARPLGSLSMARGCARIDAGPDTAKIGSADRVQDHARLLAVIGVRKTFPHGLGHLQTSNTFVLDVRQGPEPGIRCRLSSQRSANAPTAAVLYCATGPGLARLLPRGIADMIVGPLGTTFGVARSISVDCAFRTHAHVLVWSYWPSVRYCGMNCPTDRRVPSI